MSEFVLNNCLRMKQSSKLEECLSNIHIVVPGNSEPAASLYWPCLSFFSASPGSHTYAQVFNMREKKNHVLACLVVQGGSMLYDRLCLFWTKTSFYARCDDIAGTVVFHL